SRVRIVHAGRALNSDSCAPVHGQPPPNPNSARGRHERFGRVLNSDWEAAAREQERKNPRYEWVGDQSHDQAMHLLSGSRYLVLSSLMEGGASVIAEAVACGVPVLC